MRGRVAQAIPIQELGVASHKTVASWTSKRRVQFALAPEEQNGGNRDFVLRFRLAGHQVESGLLLHRGDQENYFLLMVEPPERVVPEQIPPREYVFVVDVSGSMHGFPLDTAKELMRDLAAHLRPTDTFNVMFFSGGSHLMAPRSVPATAENVARAVRLLEQHDGGGGTELFAALTRVMSLPHDHAAARSFVVITDGFISAEKEVFHYVHTNLGKASVFVFGIGSGVNHYLIEGMAKAGMGEPFVVQTPSEASRVAARFRQYIEAPVLTNIKVAYHAFKAYDVEPHSIPDLFARRPIVIHGKWTGPARGTITLSGTAGIGRYEKTLDVDQDPADSSNSALS